MHSQQPALEINIDNPLKVVLKDLLPKEIWQSIPGFERYHNFVLFSQGAFSSPAWVQLIENSPTIWHQIAEQFHVSHLAVRNAIRRSDCVRKPRIEPLYGDFGFHEEPQSCSLFWATTSITVMHWSGRKGRIKYEWSPAHTMYSRGNLCEKERIAALSDLEGKAMIDLYAGIGYWVFPALYAGARQIIACDINPYSIEGLRRGALANGFSYHIAQTPDEMPSLNAQLVIYPFSNKLCANVFKGRADVVNLGLLPDARDGLPLAMACLKNQSGVLRLHEEVAVKAGLDKHQARSSWAAAVAADLASVHTATADVTHIYRVKTLGKELEHLVADIKISTGFAC